VSDTFDNEKQITMQELHEFNKEKIRKTIREQLKQKHSIDEYAKVNTPNDSIPTTKYKVEVYPQDRNGMTPHFHFYDTEETFSLEIQIKNIEDLKILNSTDRKGIPQNKLKTWDGLSTEKKLLKKWMSESNKKDKQGKSNYDAIIFSWNLMNSENQI